MIDCVKDDNKKDWGTILGFSCMHREIDYYPSHGKKVIVLLVGKSNKELDETAQGFSLVCKRFWKWIYIVMKTGIIIEI